jgi:hypothetical protein
VDYLEADTSKAKKLLNWEPKVKFRELVRIMVDADLELAGLEAPGDGKKIIREVFGLAPLGRPGRLDGPLNELTVELSVIFRYNKINLKPAEE